MSEAVQHSAVGGTVEAAGESKTIDGVKVSISYLQETAVPVTDEEVRAYITRGNQAHLNSVVTGLRLGIDDMDVNITYELAPKPFERIRRITGYLVGTMDRWNDAKTAEEADRVKHEVSCGCSQCDR